MPNLEDQLQRYGTVLDDAAGRTTDHTELVTASSAHRGVRTALVAVAMVVVVSIVAFAVDTRATHEPAPATVPIVAPTTTSTEATTSTTTLLTAQAARDRAQAEAWIREHGGQPVDIHDAGATAMSSSAVYVLSVIGGGDSPPTTLSRVDRQSLHVVSVSETGAVDVSVGGDAVYLVKDVAPHSTVERLDPDTLLPLWTAALTNPKRVVASSDTVWVGFEHQIEQLDPQTGRVVHTVTLALTNQPDVGASIALDPAGNILYVAYGQGGGATEPIESRDAHTGSQLGSNAQGSAGLGAPEIVATDSGAWVAYRSGSVGEASFFRATDLARDGELVVNSESAFGMGVELAYGGNVLWIGNVLFVACADARSGHGLAALESDTDSNLNVFSVAADATGVAVSVNGTLGIFTPGDLCPPVKP